MTTEDLSQADRAAVRARVFTHLAGVVMVPTVSALWEHGALDLLASAAADPVPFDDIVGRTHANGGYMRVALRLLEYLGWLVEHACGDGVRAYALTRAGRAALTLARPLYRQVTASFLPKALTLDDLIARPADDSFIASVGALVTLAE